MGLLTEIPEITIAVNMLKEELPEQRQSRFWAFVLGAAAYTVLLLAL